MRTRVMYSQKIVRHSRIFGETVRAYRDAVSFFISVCLEEWENISKETVPQRRMNMLEKMTHPTSAGSLPAGTMRPVVLWISTFSAPCG